MVRDMNLNLTRAIDWQSLSPNGEMQLLFWSCFRIYRKNIFVFFTFSLFFAVVVQSLGYQNILHAENLWVYKISAQTDVISVTYGPKWGIDFCFYNNKKYLGFPSS